MTLCPQCRAEGVIATVNGPTCKHQEKTGAQWWPDGWATMPEQDRLEWLLKTRTQAK